MKLLIPSAVIVFLVATGYFLYSGAFAPKLPSAPVAEKTSFSVEIAVPLPGSLLTGTESLVAIATTNTKLKDIVLSVDGTTVTTCTTSPCSYDWDTTLATNGNHTIVATAHDESGTKVQTDPLNVAVSNQPMVQSPASKTPTQSLPVITHPIIVKPTPTPKPAPVAPTPKVVPVSANTLPVITLSPLVNDSASTEIISWKTNIPTTSHIKYGLASSLNGTYSLATNDEASAFVDHTATLTQLVAGKTYYYQIVATDANQHVVTLPEKSFTIPTMTISSPTASDLFATTASIKWTTNFKTEGQILWGSVSSSVGQYSSSTVQSTEYSTTHTATITQGSAGTTYFYRIVAIDQAGNKVTSPEYTFTTSKISISSTVYSNQGEMVSWVTTSPVKSELRYGTQSLTSNAYPFSVTDTNLATSHNTFLPGISSNTTYYYRITTTDSSGVKVTSPEYSFNS
ncbi:MAG: fibronectin type III domain-containing protein [bacterium]